MINREQKQPAADLDDSNHEEQNFIPHQLSSSYWFSRTTAQQLD